MDDGSLSDFAKAAIYSLVCAGGDAHGELRHTLQRLWSVELDAEHCTQLFTKGKHAALEEYCAPFLSDEALGRVRALARQEHALALVRAGDLQGAFQHFHRSIADLPNLDTTLLARLLTAPPHTRQDALAAFGDQAARIASLSNVLASASSTSLPTVHIHVLDSGDLLASANPSPPRATQQVSTPLSPPTPTDGPEPSPAALSGEPGEEEAVGEDGGALVDEIGEQAEAEVEVEAEAEGAVGEEVDGQQDDKAGMEDEAVEGNGEGEADNAEQQAREQEEEAVDEGKAEDDDAGEAGQDEQMAGQENREEKEGEEVAGEGEGQEEPGEGEQPVEEEAEPVADADADEQMGAEGSAANDDGALAQAPEVVSDGKADNEDGAVQAEGGSAVDDGQADASVVAEEGASDQVVVIEEDNGGDQGEGVVDVKEGDNDVEGVQEKGPEGQDEQAVAVEDGGEAADAVVVKDEVNNEQADQPDEQLDEVPDEVTEPVAVASPQPEQAQPTPQAQEKAQEDAQGKQQPPKAQDQGDDVPMPAAVASPALESPHKRKSAEPAESSPRAVGEAVEPEKKRLKVETPSHPPHQGVADKPLAFEPSAGVVVQEVMSSTKAEWIGSEPDVSPTVRKRSKGPLHSSPVRVLRFSPNAGRLLSESEQGVVAMCLQGEQASKFTHARSWTSLPQVSDRNDFHVTSNNSFFASRRKEKLVVVKLTSNSPKGVFLRNYEQQDTMQFTCSAIGERDCNVFVFGTRGGGVVEWNFKSKKTLSRVELAPSAITSILLSKDQDMVVATAGSTVYVCKKAEAQFQKLTAVDWANDCRVHAIWSADGGRALFVATSGHQLALFVVGTEQPVATTELSAPITSACAVDRKGEGIFVLCVTASPEVVVLRVQNDSWEEAHRAPLAGSDGDVLCIAGRPLPKTPTKGSSALQFAVGTRGGRVYCCEVADKAAE